METADIGQGRAYPSAISQYIPGMPDFVPLSVAFLLAILMCVLVYIFCGKQNGVMSFGQLAKTPRCRIWRHLSEKADHYRDDHLRWTRRNGRDRRGIRLPAPLLRRIFRRLGISGDRGRSARTQSSARDIYRRNLLWRASETRRDLCRHRNEIRLKDLVEVLQAIIIIFVASLPEVHEEISMGELLTLAFILILLFSSIRLATPLIFAALGWNVLRACRRDQYRSRGVDACRSIHGGRCHLPISESRISGSYRGVVAGGVVASRFCRRMYQI